MVERLGISCPKCGTDTLYQYVKNGPVLCQNCGHCEASQNNLLDLELALRDVNIKNIEIIDETYIKRGDKVINTYQADILVLRFTVIQKDGSYDFQDISLPRGLLRQFETKYGIHDNFFGYNSDIREAKE